jgi:hypothetical protein
MRLKRSLDGYFSCRKVPRRFEGEQQTDLVRERPKGSGFGSLISQMRDYVRGKRVIEKM